MIGRTVCRSCGVVRLPYLSAMANLMAQKEGYCSFFCLMKDLGQGPAFELLSQWMIEKGEIRDPDRERQSDAPSAN